MVMYKIQIKLSEIILSDQTWDEGIDYFLSYQRKRYLLTQSDVEESPLHMNNIILNYITCDKNSFGTILLHILQKNKQIS